MANDRTRVRTIMPKDLVPQHAFPEDVPEDVFYGLTAPERAFVRAYVESGNGYESYLKAGLAHGQKNTKTLSWQYLQKPRVKAAVHRLQTFYMKHMQIHAEEVLGRLASHARFDAAQLYEETGDGWALKPMRHWSLEARQCLQRVRVIERTSKDGEVRREIDLEFSDRQRALALLGKHLALFTRKEAVAPFTLILNAAPETVEKRVGKSIEGIGLRIDLSEADAP